MSELLELEHITCRYDRHVIVPDLSFSVREGQIACLLGPSGCGKTTVLRAIAGFEDIHAGSIRLADQTLSEPGKTLVPEKRRIGMVFQDYALFPHLSVSDNIAFGIQDLPAAERQRSVSQLLSLIKLEAHADHYPHQLSGGQQQRVALARALAPKPRILLLDEPFSNLDTELRRSLSLEVREILKRSNTSAILVTHDQTEAFNVADEIGVIMNGQLQQWGTPQELYHQPVNAFVAGFITSGQFISGSLKSEHVLSTVFGEHRIENEKGFAAGSRVRILIRPWNLSMVEDEHSTRGCAAEILQQQFSGAVSATRLRLEDGSEVVSNDEHIVGLLPGSKIRLALQPEHLLLFPAISV